MPSCSQFDHLLDDDEILGEIADDLSMSGWRQLIETLRNLIFELWRDKSRHIPMISQEEEEAPMFEQACNAPPCDSGLPESKVCFCVMLC